MKIFSWGEINHKYILEREDAAEGLSKKCLAKFSQMLLWMAITSVFFSIGATFYMKMEGWSFLDSIYFLAVTISTVGFGDLYPTTDFSKAFTIFTICTGFLLFCNLRSTLIQKIMKSCNCEINLLNSRKKFVGQLTNQNSEQIFSTKLFGVEVHHSNETKSLARIFACILAIVLTILVGSFYFSVAQQLTFIEALYFSVVIFTTVGYGAIVPKNEQGKVFLIVFLVVSTFMVAVSLGHISVYAFETRERKKRYTNLRNALSRDLISTTPTDNVDDDSVTCAEFVLGMLLQTGLVDYECDVEPWKEQFYKFGRGKNGKVDVSDVKGLVNKFRKNLKIEFEVEIERRKLSKSDSFVEIELNGAPIR